MPSIHANVIINLRLVIKVSVHGTIIGNPGEEGENDVRNDEKRDLLVDDVITFWKRYIAKEN